MQSFFQILCLLFSLQAGALTLEELGERLFQDDRFSEHFYKISGGDPNFKAYQGLEHLNEIYFNGQRVISPFKGQSQSCISCHTVDQAFESLSMRGYSDFSALSSIPKRADQKVHTLRNTPSLIGIGSQYNQNRFSHYDGEFFDHFQTVLGNFTGRNMGWLSSEKETALLNIVRVIRKDDGSSELAQEFGGAYFQAFQKVFNIDVSKVKNQIILDNVVQAVTAYMNGLDFETDEEGFYIGSPYDQFLKKNSIDRGPKEGEGLSLYLMRLRKELSRLSSPQFVEKKYFKTHRKSFAFGKQEFEGLKTFFNINGQSRGMCVACHAPPLFSDQFFHNVGVTQVEYDKLHGQGSFERLEVPNLDTRKDQYFLSRPTLKDSHKVDLGLWNFYKRNPTVSKYLEGILCGKECRNDSVVLNATVARFKTPSLRNLGHSGPYFHNGQASTLFETIKHYKDVAEISREGYLRNGAPQLRGINLADEDIKNLEAFLFSLNEDYE